ncbi:MAG: hypothetical protein K2N28_00670 [Muribaculaceae bacterium]|nr:hypothetical protein [Muribaculaceae bacterium]
MRGAWEWYEGKEPLPVPVEENPAPPLPYNKDENRTPLEPMPVKVEVTPIMIEPRPKPIEPIREIPHTDDKYFTIDFYGVQCKVRLPECAPRELKDCSPKSIAAGWEQLASGGCLDNTIRDCLETRIRYNLCDWAYLQFLEALSHSFCTNANDATLLMAFLYCQSGYQMRLAVDSGTLIILYGSKHYIYGKEYYNIDGCQYYPLGNVSKSISICNAAFDGEAPMSLLITGEQLLGDELSDDRTIKSKRYDNVRGVSRVPRKLIEFYNGFPSSAIGGNPLTRWSMYANVPLAGSTRAMLYPMLTSSVEGLSEIDAANRLLNWVQTGFVYEYDDKVWGHDRAFFAEETLYYPYCDCEDRSILFSRLVRDLLGLDVALIYYPGHLATAVCFNEDVDGDAMMIGDKRFVVCDPTYIGAPVGAQMPGLDYANTRAIILNR